MKWGARLRAGGPEFSHAGGGHEERIRAERGRKEGVGAKNAECSRETIGEGRGAWHSGAIMGRVGGTHLPYTSTL